MLKIVEEEIQHGRESLFLQRQFTDLAGNKG